MIWMSEEEYNKLPFVVRMQLLKRYNRYFLKKGVPFEVYLSWIKRK